MFNCALNPAMKKKKLPSVLPPPPPNVVAGKMEVPFWKEPLPHFDNMAADWEQQSTSPQDIGQKLQVRLNNCQSFELNDTYISIQNRRRHFYLKTNIY